MDFFRGEGDVIRRGDVLRLYRLAEPIEACNGKGANRQVGRRPLDPEFFREIVCMEGKIY